MQKDFEYTSEMGYTFEGTVEKTDLYGLTYRLDYVTSPDLVDCLDILLDTNYEIVNFKLADGLWEYLNSDEIWNDQD